jgi:uncharacterized protein YaaQ
MKLLLTIVQDTDAGKLQQALIESGFDSTKLSSTGGFLRQGNTTLLIGVEDHQVDTAKKIVQTTCRERTKIHTPGPTITDLEGMSATRPIEVTVGGAIVFVIEVEEFLRM